MKNAFPNKKTAFQILLVRALAALCLLVFYSSAATFPGNADVYADDPSVTWNPNTNSLTVSCWFKLSVPSSVTLSDDMVILVNQHGYAPGNPFAYLVRLNISNGNIEFVTRGSSGLSFTNTLIERPYLERWYHVAVERSGGTFAFFVDGRPGANNGSMDVGNSASMGFTVGAWGNGRYLYGEVQEFAVYQAPLDPAIVVDNMFQDQRANDGLTAYYKLGFSTNAAENLKNFAPGATTASASADGSPTFPETDQAGEQSEFDSQRNGGRDAVVPLSGAFTWQQVGFARPTPGIAFDFRFGYSSANSFSGFALGSREKFVASKMSGGWRQSFDTRLVPPGLGYDPESFNAARLMNWDGSVETWDKDPTSGRYSTRSREYRGELVSTNGDQQFLWTTPERLT